MAMKKYILDEEAVRAIVWHLSEINRISAEEKKRLFGRPTCSGKTKYAWRCLNMPKAGEKRCYLHKKKR